MTCSVRENAGSGRLLRSGSSASGQRPTPPSGVIVAIGGCIAAR